MKNTSLKELVEGLVNSKDNCSYDLIVVEKKWVDKLKKYIDDMEKAEHKQLKEQDLEKKRIDIADKLFAEATPAQLEIPEDCEVIEPEGWEHDGDGRLIQKFYYTNPVAGEDSLVGTFIVDFKKGSDKVEDVHSNTN